MKKVTVIIPMHNSAKHIEQCLQSVIEQTYPNIEIIIVDDASTDNSVEITKKYQNNCLINSVNNNKNNTKKQEHKTIQIIELPKNVGAANARNKGIEQATGEYICFLDSDDYWVLDKIKKQVQFIEENNYIFIYSNYAYLNDGKIKNAKVPKTMNYNQSLKNHAIFTSAVMLNMEKLKKEDIYMPNIKKGQDTATWWKILKKGITAYCLNEVLAIYRVGEKSLSSNKVKAIKRTWELFKTENLSAFKRIYCFMWYAINATRRRI